MDLKTATLLTRRHLASLVLVFLVFGGGFAGYFFKGFRDLSIKKEKLDNRSVDLAKRLAEIEKSEFLLKEQETLLAERQRNLDAQAQATKHNEAGVASSLARLRDEQSKLSEQAAAKEKDQEFYQLMQEISNLGGLELPTCGDKEAIERHHKARVKYDEILALAKSGNKLANYYIEPRENSIFHDYRACEAQKDPSGSLLK